MLFIASFFGTPVDVADTHAQVNTDACHSSSPAHEPLSRFAWQPASYEVSVHAYGAVRTREVATVRVIGRCVVKNAPENAQPVLYVPFGSQLDNSDDEDLAAAHSETTAQFGRPAALGPGPADLHALIASVTQLERPPRV
jgi:hypothetical protein